MFSFFKKKFQTTATELADAYKGALAKGCKPKQALEQAISVGMRQHSDLSQLQSAEQYLSHIFGDDYRNLSSNPSSAAPFVRTAFENIISTYMHPECSQMLYVMDMASSGDSNRPDNALDALLKKLI